ncbi:MAG: SDR family NAD(P)-dependent oxidoreductase [Pseudomonadota bacterium]
MTQSADASNALAGRVALVTGASSGLGAATAAALGAAGATVYVLGRNEAGLTATLEAITKAGGPAGQLIVADLGQSGAAAAAIERVASDAGHIDILVNNAAIYHGGTIAEQTADMWRDMFQVNVLSLLEAAQGAVAHMRAQKTPGHIVNISSLSARLDPGGSYGASKAAVDKISEQLRDELEGDDIRVVNIVPGAFSTNLGRNMTPEQLQGLMDAFQRAPVEPDEEGRTALVGLPDDIARAVLYAVSQPININIGEMVVRPAMNTTL